jgi:hypothetical protein
MPAVRFVVVVPVVWAAAPGRRGRVSESKGLALEAASVMARPLLGMGYACTKYTPCPGERRGERTSAAPRSVALLPRTKPSIPALPRLESMERKTGDPAVRHRPSRLALSASTLSHPPKEVCLVTTRNPLQLPLVCASLTDMNARATPDNHLPPLSPKV